MERSDIELVDAHMGGDTESFEILVLRYGKSVYAFATHLVGNAAEAEDVTQETFIKAWRHLDKFDIEKNFKTWLFAIAKNSAFDTLRKKRTIPFSRFEDESGNNMLLETLTDPEPIPDEIFAKLEAADALHDALPKLSPDMRAVLSLYYGEELTFREIGEILGKPLDTVKSQHRRACIMLAKLLAEQS